MSTILDTEEPSEEELLLRSQREEEMEKLKGQFPWYFEQNDEHSWWSKQPSEIANLRARLEGPAKQRSAAQKLVAKQLSSQMPTEHERWASFQVKMDLIAPFAIVPSTAGGHVHIIAKRHSKRGPKKKNE
jgi:Fe-S cluster assembly scaffold protein SufB